MNLILEEWKKENKEERQEKKGIKLDYLTLTSKNPNLEEFFWNVLGKIRKDFGILSEKKHSLYWGSRPYKGVMCRETAKNRKKSSCFMGSRMNNKNETEYLLTIAGEKADLFGKELFKKVSTDWRITRIDVQTTFESGFINQSELVTEYYSFCVAQKQRELLKPQNRRRKVCLNEAENYISTQVGSRKTANPVIKIYSKLKGHYFEIRLELIIKDRKRLKQLTEKNHSNFQNYWNIDFKDLLKQALANLVDTPLLQTHRDFLEVPYQSAKKSISKKKLQLKTLSSKEDLKFQLKKNLIAVVNAHQSLANVLKPNLGVVSHKQVQYLNQQFPRKSWRIAWANPTQWALIPTETNALWKPLFSPLPGLTKEYIEQAQKRQTALLSLAKHIEKVATHCQTIPIRKKPYLNEPRVSPLISQLFQVLVQFEPINGDIQRLPRRKNNDFYFEDNSEYVQNIIRQRFNPINPSI